MADEITNFPHANPDQGSLELTEEFIRLRAYQLFEKRGREHGHDVEDWLQAEAEILGTQKEVVSESAESTEPKTRGVAA